MGTLLGEQMVVASCNTLIQLHVGSLRLCLGTLIAAECHTLIRIIKSSCNTNSKDACASGALLGRTLHDAILHTACACHLLPALWLLLKAKS